MSRALAEACPGLAGALREIGVSVAVADNREKSLPAAMRSAQNDSPHLSFRRRRSGRKDQLGLAELCELALADNHFDFRFIDNRTGGPEFRERRAAWLALPAHPMSGALTKEIKWTPGPWLHSWEASIGPVQPRYFHRSSDESCVWLLTGLSEDDDFEDEDHEIDVFSSDIYDNRFELLKDLLKNWPNEPVDIAREAGLTLKELNWLASGKMQFDGPQTQTLCDILRIEFDRMDYHVSGPSVLLAKNANALERTYPDCSHGGDAEPFELIPSSGIADPSWRYFVVNACGMPLMIVMAPRGERITERMPDILFNFREKKAVPQDVYRDVVASCARACLNPSANRTEMTALKERHRELFASD